MRNILLRITGIVFVIFILIFTASSWLKLRPSFYQFDVQAINITPEIKTESAGTRLDAVLLEHLPKFSYIRSFDHVFAQPSEEIILEKSLWVNRCEISQKDFQQFTQWQKINKKVQIASVIQPPDWTYKSNTTDHLISGKFSAPVNGVTYYDAYAYCRAAGGRLPYHHEWIAAASGKANRLYANGNELNLNAWPYLDPLHNSAQSCGLHKNTATPENIQDLNNNVSEWAQNSDNPVKPIIIGGNAYNKPYEIYALNLLYRFAPPEYRSPYVGFRCVYPRRPNKTPWNTNQSAAKIAAGHYPMGIPEDAKIPNLLNTLPRRQIETILDIFNWQNQPAAKRLYITRHEITREQYADFLDDVFVQLGLYADENEPEQHNYLPPDWESQIKNPQLPVTNIDWWSAYAFANWAGGRLLSAEEWTLAASSGGRYIYPSSNKLPDSFAVAASDRQIQMPGKNSDDITLEGLYDMSSNVSEWTQSVTVSDGGYAIVVKGGNFLLPSAPTARIDFRNHVPQHYRSPTIGFRIAFDHLP